MNAKSNARLTFLALKITSRLAGRFTERLEEKEVSEIRRLADELSQDKIEWVYGAAAAEDFEPPHQANLARRLEGSRS